MTLFVGTSGFYYNHWIGKFYPEGTKKSDFFKFYIEKFNTLELNSTFYRVPPVKTVENWAKRCGEDFKFSVKMWRKVTHYKKLKDVEEDLKFFFERISHFKEKLGVILIQLPPSIHKEVSFLEGFINLLPGNFRYAIEFRHKSWFSDEILSLLKKYRIAFCSVSMRGLPDDIFKTTDFIYYRFHGKTSLYNYNYSENELKNFSEKLKSKSSDVNDCYIFFNNDFNSYAPYNAMLLKKLIEYK